MGTDSFSPRLSVVSGGVGKTPACFLVETGKLRFVLDMGVGPPLGLLPDVSTIGHVDAVLLSHGHRDHMGALHLRSQLGNPPVFAPQPIIWQLPPDVAAEPLPLVGETAVLGVRVRTGRNGHSPGGVWLHLDVGDGLLYMADHSCESLIYARDAPPCAATLIVDASYGAYDEALSHCIDRLQSVLARGDALLPIPVMGRGPEILFHIARQETVLPRIGDDFRATLRRIAQHNADSLHSGVTAELERIANEAPPIDGPRGHMLAGDAYGHTGESARLVAQWEPRPDPQFVFTGYVTPTTPAERLIKNGRGLHIRWNVHARLSDNVAIARSVRARQVIAAFCEAQDFPAFCAALAPARVVAGACAL